MRQKLILLMATNFALQSFIGCNRAHAVPSVFGTDSRQTAASWLPIGKLSDGTAFAVGPHTILSAAHVVYGLRFPATIYMNDGNSYTVSNLIEVGQTIAPGNIHVSQIANDWSIMNVEGTFPKWFRLSSAQTGGERIQLAGYSQDRIGASIDADCSILSIYGALLNHDCDMVPGASGAPLFHYGNDDGTNKADFYVIGVQSGQICDRADGNCLYPNGWNDSISNRAAAITNYIIAVVKQLNHQRR